MVKEIRNRNFTDIICGLLFIAYSIFMAYMMIYGWSKGNLDNVAQPFDSDKRPCGIGNYYDYQFLYINQPFSTDIFKELLCVKTCPTNSQQKIECLPTQQNSSCDNLNVYESYGFLSRICLPIDSAAYNSVLSFIKLDYLSQAIQEIRTAWPNYLIAFGLALVICLLFYFIMRFFAGCMVWLIILGTLVGFWVGGGLLYYKYQ